MKNTINKKSLWGVLFFSTFVIAFGCQTTQRKPASDTEIETLKQAYSDQIYYQIAEDQALINKNWEEWQNSSRNNSRGGGVQPLISPDWPKPKELEELRQKSAKSTEEMKNIQIANPDPVHVTVPFNGRWRRTQESWFLRDPNLYRLQNGEINRSMYLDFLSAKKYELLVRNFYWSKTLKVPASSNNSHYFAAKMKCDQPWELNRAIFDRNVKANDWTEFQIYDSEHNGENLIFDLSPSTTNCELLWKMPGEKDFIFGVKFSNDLLKPERQQAEFCYLPAVTQLGPVEQFFLSADFKSQTCPSEVPAVKLLSDPIEGFQAKVESLLGQRLPDSFITNQNPKAPIDFSLAPKLDEIYISYLVFRADFGGTVIKRLLEYHAQNGTRIRIFVSHVIQLEKDRQQLTEFVSKYPNAKLREYKFVGHKVIGFKEWFSKFHRSNHVKLFITYSETDPSLNKVFWGGRNIHDGFLFKKAPNLSEHKDLVQYGKKLDENFGHWRDMEYLIQDQSFVHRLIGHYLTAWELDSKSFFQRSFNVNIKTQTEVRPEYFKGENPLVRHIITLPFKDGRTLEDFYVKMILSAQSKITIVSPYFRPTKAISEAMNEVSSRGIKISVLTRFDMEGDIAKGFLSDVNKISANKFRDMMNIYEFTVKGEILHSKIILIDDKLSFVGGVNLNNRSFIHDTENGMLVYSTKFNQEMQSLVEGYLGNDERGLPKAQLIIGEQKIKWINRVLLNIGVVKEAF